MLISFDCPKCLKPARGEVTAASRGVMCTDCGWTKPVADGDVSDGTPTRCLVCGCSDLWRQKDFSPKLGVTIVAIGIAISTWFMMQMQPEWSIGTLMAFALADMVMFAVMRDCLVCYRCHSRYRRVPRLEQVAAFDLEVNERYRQEAIRLKQAGGGQGDKESGRQGEKS